MNMHIASPAVKPHIEDTPGERDLLLTAIRAASARSLITNELNSIGVSLRHKAINCEQCLEWLKDEGLLHWIHLGPEVAR